MSLPTWNTAVAILILLAFGKIGTSGAPLITVETVPVGNPGNPPDKRTFYNGIGGGGVKYLYHIGKFEITAGQYTAFLNAVAASDPRGLYSTAMMDPEGCGIERSGSPGSYTYTVPTDWANRPVNNVSWGDAARFANWMHNGQPEGAQDFYTTEDGSYFLNGATNDASLMAVQRERTATWVIPTDEEWYKAAYHKNDGLTTNYWTYPTRSDVPPSNLLLNPDPGNNANFLTNGYTIGSPYYRTEAGEFENSASPYGTFDQGGNVFEWVEYCYQQYRASRGGAYRDVSWYYLGAAQLAAGYPGFSQPPTSKGGAFGFRLARIPRETTYMQAARANHTATLLANGKVLVAGGCSSLATELYDATTGIWAATTGSMITVRSNHTATLLSNGKVLVVAGYSSTGSILASAELFDPARSTWSTTAPLPVARAKHTATMLPNGKVLVIGGASQLQEPVADARVYDPLAGGWAAAGLLRTPRFSHTATLLRNGKVLIVGGTTTNQTPTDSAELFDPAAGMFTELRSMAATRQHHTATLLSDGQVLVAGGTGSEGVPLDSAELFNPSRGEWTSAGSLPSPVSKHTATLLPNGEVLVVSSSSNSVAVYSTASGTWKTDRDPVTPRFAHTSTLLPSGKILIAGGEMPGGGAGLSSVEVYNSTTRKWAPTVLGTMSNTSAISNMAAYVNGHSATLLPGGKVVLSGEVSQIYDLNTGTWTSLGAQTASGRTVLLPNGKVLCVGDDFNTPVAAAALYDDAAGVWTETGSLNIPRVHYSMTLLNNGKVLIVGGQSGWNETSALNIPEIYNPATGLFTTAAQAAFFRLKHSATLLQDGRVLIAGGERYNPSTGGLAIVTTTELFDPATGTWTRPASMAYPRYWHSATLLPNGKVLVAGGFTYNGRFIARAETELYDPSTGTWTSAGLLNHARGGHTATLLPNGTVLVAGGESEDFYTYGLESVEIFDPMTLKWTLAAPLLTTRERHSATLLPNGKVLFASGLYTWGTAEIYDVGLSFTTNLQPQVASISQAKVGHPLTVSGSGFRGVSEASGGGQNGSPTDYPLLQLRSAESGQTVFLSCTNWSETAFDCSPLPVFHPGWALATVFVNGIPSSSVFTKVRGRVNIILGNLQQVYNGSARPVSVTTVPAGEPVTVTYNGLPETPTNLGTYSVVATVENDTFFGSVTNVLRIVRKLTVAPAVYTRAAGTSLRIPVSELMTNVTSLPADGVPFYLANVWPSSQGVNISTNQQYVFYAPQHDLMDSFVYSVTDREGGSGVGSVFVEIAGATGAALPASSIRLDGNTAIINSFGIPGRPYVLQTATNVNGPWLPVSTNTASTQDGSLTFIVPQVSAEQQYYRTAQP